MDLLLITEPWADVYWNGIKLGTTPLSGPLRMASGTQRLVLRNPAFPPVELPLELTQPALRLEIPLAGQTVRVRTNVNPWGELYVDGEHVGTTPLGRPLYVSPGKHTVRISHPQLNALEQDFSAQRGEAVIVSADLAQGVLKNQSAEREHTVKSLLLLLLGGILLFSGLAAAAEEPSADLLAVDSAFVGGDYERAELLALRALQNPALRATHARG